MVEDNITVLIIGVILTVIGVAIFIFAINGYFMNNLMFEVLSIIFFFVGGKFVLDGLKV